MESNYGKCIYDHIKECSGKYPKNIAISYFNKCWTYEEYFKNVEVLARGLVELGIKEGDAVTVCSLNTPEAVFMVSALTKIGAIISPIDAHSNGPSLNYYANFTKSKYVFTNDVSYERVLAGLDGTDIKKVIISGVSESLDSSLEEVKYDDERFIKYGDVYSNGLSSDVSIDVPYDPERPAIYMPTGGTTGISKVVAITNEGLIAANEYYKEILNFSEGKTCMTFLPLMIVSGINANLFLPLCSGQKVALCLSYDPKDFVNNIINTQPDFVVAAPVYWIKLKDAVLSGAITKEQLPHIKNPMCAGDYILPEVEKACNEALGFPLKKAYALTESTSCGLVTTSDNNYLGSTGIPAGKLSVKLIDPSAGSDEVEVPLNTPGHMYIYGKTVAKGYLNNEGENNITFGQDENGERYVRTGDLLTVDEKGNYHFVGRIKRMILRKGYNIFPALIEQVISMHPAVANCAVVGIDDYEEGQIPVAHVVLKPGYGEMQESVREEVKALVEANVPFYFCPETYFIDEMLPTTDRANKIDYMALKQLTLKK